MYEVGCGCGSDANPAPFHRLATRALLPAALLQDIDPG